MYDEIWDCDGKYEVHPSGKGGYCVANSDTGEVVKCFSNLDDAIRSATKMNRDYQQD